MTEYLSIIHPQHVIIYAMNAATYNIYDAPIHNYIVTVHVIRTDLPCSTSIPQFFAVVISALTSISARLHCGSLRLNAANRRCGQHNWFLVGTVTDYQRQDVFMADRAAARRAVQSLHATVTPDQPWLALLVPCSVRFIHSLFLSACSFHLVPDSTIRPAGCCVTSSWRNDDVMRPCRVWKHSRMRFVSRNSAVVSLMPFVAKRFNYSQWNVRRGCTQKRSSTSYMQRRLGSWRPLIRLECLQRYQNSTNQYSYSHLEIYDVSLTSRRCRFLATIAVKTALYFLSCRKHTSKLCLRLFFIQYTGQIPSSWSFKNWIVSG